MKTILASIIACSLFLTGCETLPDNATPQQKAQAAINNVTTGAKFVIGPAVTAWLLWQKDIKKQQQDAAMVYAAATAINSLATGVTPAPAELQRIIAQFTGGGDPRYLALANVLASEYTNLYSLFHIAGTTPAKFFGEVAMQAMNAAQPFLAPK